MILHHTKGSQMRYIDFAVSSQRGGQSGFLAPHARDEHAPDCMCTHLPTLTLPTFRYTYNGDVQAKQSWVSCLCKVRDVVSSLVSLYYQQGIRVRAPGSPLLPH
jgi:hypothetical protein